MNMDRLTSMAVFVKAAELGSFAATAAELGLSAPMVGKHIQFLEDRLKIQLINRTTRRQSLTEFGQIYYQRCKIILAEVNSTELFIADQLAEPYGKFRITMPVHFGRHCVLPVILNLFRQHPGIKLDLSFSDRIIDLAEDGYDLAIRTGTLTERAGLVARRVASQAMAVCASPAYLERWGHPQKIDDLPGLPAIVYRRSGLVPPWLFPCTDQPPLEIAPLSSLRLDDLDAIADAATAGAGIAWLPYWLIRERVLSGALVHLFADQPGYLYDVHALWLQTPHLSRKIRLAVDALVTALPSLMSGIDGTVRPANPTEA